MFKNIYYDSWNNKMHLWEIGEDGKTVYNVFKHDIEYYVLDKSGKSPIKSIFNEPVIRKVTDKKDSLKYLKESGERLFESDLSEEVKFLQKRYGNTDYKIDIKNYNIYNVDIENEFPDSPTINLIGIENYHTGEVWQLGLQPYTGTNKETTYIHCDSESVLLERFCKFLKLKKVEYVTNWNGLAFDFPKIQERIDALNLKCSMSPIGKVIKKHNGEIQIVGIDILDLMVLYKKFTFKNQPSFSLDYIGNLEVGEGKLEYEGTITDFWKTDWNRFVDYNWQDLKLVSKIDKKKKLLNLAIGMGTDSRIPFSHVTSPIAVIEGDLLREMHSNDMVMEDITHNIAYEKTRSIVGGHVESFPGFYIDEINFDVTSMYPHNTMMFNISKETKVLNPSEDEIPNLIKSHIPGVYYKKEEGLLPKITKKAFNKRKEYKKAMFKEKKNHNNELAEYYDSQQLIQKIKINAEFGASANPHFHFYDFDNASQITAAGRDAIQYASQAVNNYLLTDFWKVAKEYYPNYKDTYTKDKKTIISLIDTDSFYITINHLYKYLAPELSFLDFVLDFEKRVVEPFLKKIMDEYAAKYNTTNLLHFKREKVIIKLYVQAKKKYACLSIANEEEIYDKPKLSVTGIETKKSDLCKYSRKNLDSLLNLIFEGDKPNKRNMEIFIRNAYKEFRNQNVSDISVPKGVQDYDKYNKDLTNDITNFLPSTPIHNRASMIYNYIVKEHNLPLVEITNGTKMKYVYVNPKNIYKTNVVGYVGNWPEAFNKFFKVDFDTQFEKQYLQIAQRMFDTLGFGLVTLRDSKLLKMIEDD